MLIMRKRKKTLFWLDGSKNNYINALKNDPGKAGDIDNVSEMDWMDKGETEGNEIIGGKMYWNGTVYVVVDLGKNGAEVIIEAKKTNGLDAIGESDDKIAPYMIVRVDDDVVGEVFVDNDEWQEYSFNTSIGGGIKVLSIEYVNDLYDGPQGIDRNLFIGKARVEILS